VCCGSDRRTWPPAILLFDAAAPLDPEHPEFVWFSEQYGQPERYFDQIPVGEWHDLVFFARAPLVAGGQYHVSPTRAFDRIDSPVELCSRSKLRLAWGDVEFRRDDVIREWPGVGDGLDQVAAGKKPPGLGTKVIVTPISDRDLRGWYEQRVKALTAQARTSSGEEDWAAAREQLPDRVTRARVRSIRDQCAPEAWRKRGRSKAKTAE
jgi:hypothetical protein